MGPHPHDNEANKLRLLAFRLLLCPDMLFTHQGFEHVVGQGACVDSIRWRFSILEAISQPNVAGRQMAKTICDILHVMVNWASETLPAFWARAIPQSLPMPGPAVAASSAPGEIGMASAGSDVGTKQQEGAAVEQIATPPRGVEQQEGAAPRRRGRVLNICVGDAIRAHDFRMKQGNTIRDLRSRLWEIYKDTMEDIEQLKVCVHNVNATLHAAPCPLINPAVTHFFVDHARI